MPVSVKRTRKAARPAARTRGGASAPCPDCGGNSRVVDTRRSASGTVTRWRVCVCCDRKFVSHERSEK
jgi:hypothetical protein